MISATAGILLAASPTQWRQPTLSPPRAPHTAVRGRLHPTIWEGIMQGPTRKLKLTTEELRPLGDSAQQGEESIWTIVLSFLYCTEECGRMGNGDTSGYSCAKNGY